MLGEELVDRDLPAQATTHRRRDQHQRDVQASQPEHEVAVEPGQTGVDVVSDRLVRQVDLGHSDDVLGRSGAERHVDLDCFLAEGSAVVGVAVESRDAGRDLSLSGLERLVVGFALETGVVVCEHDTAIDVPHPQTEQVVTGDGVGRHLLQPGDLVG